MKIIKTNFIRLSNKNTNRQSYKGKYFLKLLNFYIAKLILNFKSFSSIKQDFLIVIIRIVDIDDLYDFEVFRTTKTIIIIYN